MTEMISLFLIEAEPEVQSREGGLDDAEVARYAEAMSAGVTFPPGGHEQLCRVKLGLVNRLEQILGTVSP